MAVLVVEQLVWLVYVQDFLSCIHASSKIFFREPAILLLFSVSTLGLIIEKLWKKVAFIFAGVDNSGKRA